MIHFILFVASAVVFGLVAGLTSLVSIEISCIAMALILAALGAWMGAECTFLSFKRVVAYTATAVMTIMLAAHGTSPALILVGAPCTTFVPFFMAESIGPWIKSLLRKTV